MSQNTETKDSKIDVDDDEVAIPINTKKIKIIIASICIIAILASVVAILFSINKKPAPTIDNQLSYLATQIKTDDYNNIRQFFVFNNCSYFTDKVLNELLPQSEFVVLSDKELYATYTDKNSNYMAEFTDKTQVSFKKNSDGLFDVSEIYLAEPISIKVWKDSTLTINGSKISKDFYDATNSDDQYDCYTFKYFPKYDNDVTVKNALYGSYDYIVSDKPSAEVVCKNVDNVFLTQALYVVKDLFNTATTALDELDFTKFSESFLPYDLTSDTGYKSSILKEIYNLGLENRQHSSEYVKFYNVSIKSVDLLELNGQLVSDTDILTNEVKSVEVTATPDTTTTAISNIEETEETTPEIIYSTLNSDGSITFKCRVIEVWLVGKSTDKVEQSFDVTVSLINKNNKWYIKDLSSYDVFNRLNNLKGVDD